jgi:hypothetical protein
MGADQTDALLSAVQACVEKVRTPALPPSHFNPSRPAVSTPHSVARWCSSPTAAGHCVRVGAAQVACRQVGL